ncbi:18317_t:CDS:1, partial [Rhizophagus irregularis]
KEMVCNSRTDGRNAYEETAKWMLEYLFKENLVAPTFIGIIISSYNNLIEM